MPLADFYSLSYLWVSTLGFIVAVLFGLIGSFALGELTNLLSTAVAVAIIWRVFFVDILKCVFKASIVKDMVNKPNWQGATSLLFRKHGGVEFRTMKTNQIQPRQYHAISRRYL